jgi:hypothetical protein
MIRRRTIRQNYLKNIRSVNRESGLTNSHSDKKGDGSDCELHCGEKADGEIVVVVSK